MGVTKYCMLAFTAIVAATVLKQWKSDFLPLLRIAVAVLFGIGLLQTIPPLVQYLGSLVGSEELNPYWQILFKALGIALLSEWCASVCRECGENGAASGVEAVGKINILLLCLPMIGEILTRVNELFGFGS